MRRNRATLALVMIVVGALPRLSIASDGTTGPLTPIQPPIVFPVVTNALMPGSAVAVRGDWLAVRGPNPQVSIFHRDARGTWAPHSIVTSPNGGQTFGTAIAIGGDTLIVGQPGNGAPPGRVLVYALDAPQPPLAQTILGPTTTNAGFGSALALDGDTLLVGRGAIWHYERDGAGIWQSFGTAPTAPAPVSSSVGTSLAIDSKRVVVGDPGASTGGPFIWSGGIALVYDRPDGGAWSEPQVLAPTAPQGLEEFGTSVAIDGEVIAVGAPGLATDNGTNEGGVFVYRLSHERGEIALEATLGPRVGGPYEAFGRRVAAEAGAIAVLRVPELFGMPRPPGVETFARTSAGEWTRAAEFSHPAPGSLVASFDSDGATLVMSRGRGSGSTVARVGIVPKALDCDQNGTLDALEAIESPSSDCDLNLRLDACDLAAGGADACDDDCDADGVADWTAVEQRLVPDCNRNGTPDSCDLITGTALDVDGDGVPDSCANDCNRNGIPDPWETAQGLAEDCDGDGVPDECGDYGSSALPAAAGGISGTTPVFTTMAHARRFKVRAGHETIARVEFGLPAQGSPAPCELKFVPVTVGILAAPKGAATPAGATLLWSTSFTSGPLPTGLTWYSLDIPMLEVGEEGDVFFVAVSFTKPIGCASTSAWHTLGVTPCTTTFAPTCGDTFLGIDYLGSPTDLESLMSQMIEAPWAAAIQVHSIPCNLVADLNGDGDVDGADLTVVLGAWGPCAQCGQCSADLNSDCVVDGGDITIVLGSWTG